MKTNTQWIVVSPESQQCCVKLLKIGTPFIAIPTTPVGKHVVDRILTGTLDMVNWYVCGEMFFASFPVIKAGQG